jgi:hypothetical protein
MQKKKTGIPKSYILSFLRNVVKKRSSKIAERKFLTAVEYHLLLLLGAGGGGVSCRSSMLDLEADVVMMNVLSPIFIVALFPHDGRIGRCHLERCLER